MTDTDREIARLRTILDNVEMGLTDICSGDDGPVLLNSAAALCARRAEAASLLCYVKIARRSVVDQT